MSKIVFMFVVLVGSWTWADEPRVVRVELAPYHSGPKVHTLDISCGGGQSAKPRFCDYVVKQFWSNGGTSFGTAVCAVRANGRCPEANECAFENASLLDTSINGTWTTKVGEIDSPSNTAGRRSSKEAIEASSGLPDPKHR